VSPPCLVQPRGDTGCDSRRAGGIHAVQRGIHQPHASTLEFEQCVDLPPDALTPGRRDGGWLTARFANRLKGLPELWRAAVLRPFYGVVSRVTDRSSNNGPRA
jgi:hypothetical protein